MTEKHIDIERNRDEVIRVTQSVYNGRPYVGLRVWFEGKSGKLLPTRRGVTFSPSRIDDVIAALKELRQAAG